MNAEDVHKCQRKPDNKPGNFSVFRLFRNTKNNKNKNKCENNFDYEGTENADMA